MTHPANSSLVEMYWTPALPEKYVVRDSAGEMWVMPADPMGPDAFDRAIPYRGNYTLNPLETPGILRFYQRHTKETP